MKFALFDSNGLPTAFYALDIHGDNIPAEAIQIEDGQWQDFIDNNGRRKWADGVVVAYEPPPHVPTISDYQSAIQAQWMKLPAASNSMTA